MAATQTLAPSRVNLVVTFGTQTRLRCPECDRYLAKAIEPRCDRCDLIYVPQTDGSFSVRQLPQ